VTDCDYYIIYIIYIIESESTTFGTRELINSPVMKQTRSTVSMWRTKQWLGEQLANGPVPSALIRENAAKVGISSASLYRAADKMGVESTYVGRNTVWSRTLPPPQFGSDVKLRATPREL
jgi:hypothetical protein